MLQIKPMPIILYLLKVFSKILHKEIVLQKQRVSKFIYTNISKNTKQSFEENTHLYKYVNIYNFMTKTGLIFPNAFALFI